MRAVIKAGPGVGQIAVLDAIPAAAIEVTLAAVLACWCFYRTCCRKQVDAFGRIAKRSLAIRSSVCVAGQAVNVLSIRERGIFALLPAISCMAGHALVLVAL